MGNSTIGSWRPRPITMAPAISIAIWRAARPCLWKRRITSRTSLRMFRYKGRLFRSPKGVYRYVCHFGLEVGLYALRRRARLGGHALDRGQDHRSLAIEAPGQQEGHG